MVLLFAATIFAGAALLFLLQPMFARMVLPLLGGAPAVWNTAMVFYQAILLLGYAFAHLTVSRFGPRRQAMVQVVVLLLPFAVLPLAIPAGWTPPTATSPLPWLLALMTVAIGLPFFVVSTMSPLLQKWFAATGHARAADPYFLYSASNLGSMGALLAYPLLLEPRWSLARQAQIWTGGYVLFALLAVAAAVCVWRAGLAPAVATPDKARRPSLRPADGSAMRGGTDLRRAGQAPALQETNTSRSFGQGPAMNAGPTFESTLPQRSEHLTGRRRLRWVLLSFVPSSLMLGVTSFLTSEIAVVPLLWVVPLALYLLTFVLAFQPGTTRFVATLSRAFAILVVTLVVAINMRATQPLLWLMLLHLLVFALAALLCHTRLAADRPATSHLTEFYLWLSVGGVLGGIFNALLAPVLFTDVIEYPLAIVLAVFCVAEFPGDSSRRARWLDWMAPLALAGGTIALVELIERSRYQTMPAVLGIVFGAPALVCFFFSRRRVRFAIGLAGLLIAGAFHRGERGRLLHAERSFFGVHRVAVDPTGQYNQLVHGRTLHGTQSRDPARRRESLAYYHVSGPAGQILELYGRDPARKVGVIGLGAGSLAAFAQAGQSWTFFEIDPVVEKLARDPRYFTFLSDSPGNPRVVLGDARLSLVSEPARQFDLFFIDAFSSDAIPVHLVTREALGLYVEKLAGQGIMAFHISNLHLDLEPVLATLARAAGLVALVRDDTDISLGEQLAGKQPSIWLVMARTTPDVANLLRDSRWRLARAGGPRTLWTDEYSSLLSILRH